jgi:MYXO-CTERM domain-containing protein
LTSGSTRTANGAGLITLATLLAWRRRQGFLRS